jgi:hypothetical protein
MRPRLRIALGWVSGALLVFPGRLAAQDAPAAGAAPPPVCALWMEFQDDVARARQEVGALSNGIVYFYHSEDPAVIEPLLRFAYRRKALADSLRALPPSDEAYPPCGEGIWHTPPFDLEISTAAHGFFAILTSPRPEIVKHLQGLAAIAVPRRLAVWF